MNKKEKQFIYNLLNNDYLLTACDYDFAQEDEESFRKNHKMSSVEALKIIDKFLEELKSKL